MYTMQQQAGIIRSTHLQVDEKEKAVSVWMSDS